jgi:hypothetical protein
MLFAGVFNESTMAAMTEAIHRTNWHEVFLSLEGKDLLTEIERFFNSIPNILNSSPGSTVSSQGSSDSEATIPGLADDVVDPEILIMTMTSHPLAPLIATGNFTRHLLLIESKTRMQMWKHSMESLHQGPKKAQRDRVKLVEELKVLEKSIQTMAMTDEMMEYLRRQSEDNTSTSTSTSTPSAGSTESSVAPQESEEEGAATTTTMTSTTASHIKDDISSHHHGSTQASSQPQNQPLSSHHLRTPRPPRYTEFDLDTSCLAAAAYYFPVTQYVTSHFGMLETGVGILEDVRIQDQQSFQGQTGEVMQYISYCNISYKLFKFG